MSPEYLAETYGSFVIAGFWQLLPALLSLGLSLANQAGAFGGQDQGPKLPKPAKPVQDLTDFGKYAGTKLGKSPFQFGSGITPLQESTQIATFGTQGNDSIYRDPSAQKYFRDLLLSRTLDNKGRLRQDARILPVEQQYIQSVLGENILNPDDPASSLSAVIRALG